MDINICFHGYGSKLKIILYFQINI